MQLVIQLTVRRSFSSRSASQKKKFCLSETVNIFARLAMDRLLSILFASERHSKNKIMSSTTASTVAAVLWPAAVL